VYGVDAITKSTEEENHYQGEFSSFVQRAKVIQGIVALGITL